MKGGARLKRKSILAEELYRLKTHEKTNKQQRHPTTKRKEKTMAFDIGGFIGNIQGAQNKVDGLMTDLSSDAAQNDPGLMMKYSMELMRANQRLTIMSESFTKTMKANTDAQKAAITNMH
jgi:hypothetical protein